MRVDVALDGVFEIGDGFENATPDFSAGDGREKSFDRVEPRRRCRGEMKRPSRMIRQPRQDIGMFVSGVVVGDGVNDFPGRHIPLDCVEEANEFLMPMLLHAAPDDGSVKDIEGGKERCRAVALVVMRHCSTLARLDRQARLSAVERLNLAFLVNGDDDGVSWRIHVKADDVFDFLGEFGIAGAFERAQAMRLKR